MRPGRYWDSFRERVDSIGSLPRFVVRGVEVEEYLRCGILAKIQDWFAREASFVLPTPAGRSSAT